MHHLTVFSSTYSYKPLKEVFLLKIPRFTKVLVLVILTDIMPLCDLIGHVYNILWEDGP